MFGKGFENRSQIICDDSVNSPCERLLRSLFPKVMDVCEAAVQQVRVGEQNHPMAKKANDECDASQGEKGASDEMRANKKGCHKNE